MGFSKAYSLGRRSPPCAGSSGSSPLHVGHTDLVGHTMHVQLI